MLKFQIKTIVFILYNFIVCFCKKYKHCAILEMNKKKISPPYVIFRKRFVDPIGWHKLVREVSSGRNVLVSDLLFNII